MSDPYLILFDVDGTLVDSQGDIVAAMTIAFKTIERPVPTRGQILSIVGLSLPVAMARLAAGTSDQQQVMMVEAYKDAYARLRSEGDIKMTSPLYPGAQQVLDDLRDRPNVLLGIATGKSRRGLDVLLDGHDLRDYFVTEQVADHHPSKPHPSMILTALSETGAMAERTVMIGDTSFDMEMGRAAQVDTIGVTWGCHPEQHLRQAGAGTIVSDYQSLAEALEKRVA
ncbi:HAD-IA family hydrolase [Pseudaestuariivita rosea]|uniref:HAD-IA family hydrolase n=1 Tax=Pseudaestuariivita rosea TaxID=2763263 RepID=UPI001ABA8F0D|nr:HAD-IA family hydrolase [Pseudaestuariivita rosea]